MFDAPIARMERARGRAAVGLEDRRGAVRLADLAQTGAAKAFLPRVWGPVPEVVFLNTAGGLTGGDRLDYALALGAGCRAVGTTQTAERAYASTGGPAVARVRMSVGPGGHLAWLPQETILFEHSHLDRMTEIDLAEDAGCLFLETVVVGRAAMGERPVAARLTDRRVIRRAGRPVMIEPVEITPEVLAAPERGALLAGARALATLVVVGQGAGDLLDPARAVLDEPGVTAAASAFDGRCVVRLMAGDLWPVRRQILRLLPLMPGRPCPRVWQN